MTDLLWHRFCDVLLRNLSRVESAAQLKPETVLADLGLDSMRAVDLLFDLETTFSVVFPDALLTAETFASVQSLHEAIRKLVAEGSVS